MWDIDQPRVSSGSHERPKDDVCVESVRLPTADIDRRGPWVAFVPRADMCVAANIGGSFDQSVGSKQERFWNREAHCLRSLQVNGQFEFGGLLDR